MLSYLNVLSRKYKYNLLHWSVITNNSDRSEYWLDKIQNFWFYFSIWNALWKYFLKNYTFIKEAFKQFFNTFLESYLSGILKSIFYNIEF